MKINFIAIIMISLLLIVFTGINYYIGLRGLQFSKNLFSSINNKIYWGIFWFVAFSYLFSKLGELYFPSTINTVLVYMGSIWMIVMVYLLFILIFIDGIKLLKIIPDNIKNSQYTILITGLIVIFFIISIITYGLLNAKNLVVTNYKIEIFKKAGVLKELNVVMLSDLHLGIIVGNKQLINIVDKINSLNPDLVVFAGDIIDGNIEPIIKQNMTNTLSKIKSKYGMVGALGNHEYYGNSTNKIVNNLEKSGIKILRDKYLKVANSIYIVGREDSAYQSSSKRNKLPQIMDGIDTSFPIILIDHQPSKLVDGIQNGVDLQLSGHTHSGQVFPFMYITNKIFEVSYGYFNKDNYNIIVSQGAGTWGPPLRIGSKSEIVNIKIEFSSINH